VAEKEVRPKPVGTLIKRTSSSDLLKNIFEKVEENQEINVGAV
jgi:hypothetical protein